MTLRRLPMVPAWLVMVVIAASMIYPIVFVVTSSLKTPKEYATNPLGLPIEPTTSILSDIWGRGNIGQATLVSLLATTLAVVILSVVAMLAGWALGAIEFRGRSLILGIVVMLMMMSPTVLIAPIFSVVKALSLLNSILGLSLVYASIHLPFAAFLISSYARSIPKVLIEAAEVDGASTWRAFWSIGFPLLRPGILTVATLTFLWIWNELLFGLILLQTPELRTVQVAVAALQGRIGSPVPEVAAGMFFSMIAPLIVFIFFQRNVAEGLVAGSVK